MWFRGGGIVYTFPFSSPVTRNLWYTAVGGVVNGENMFAFRAVGLDGDIFTERTVVWMGTAEWF